MVRAVLRDPAATKRRLMKEVGLTAAAAELYLQVLQDGSLPASRRNREVDVLLSKGMVILSGDNREYVPVHPRLAVANSYRTWREDMVREINERRMRADRLILELVTVYEAAMEKKLGEGR